MRAILAFCEGNHDIVFVTRSLGCQFRFPGDPMTQVLNRRTAATAFPGPRFPSLGGVSVRSTW
jgi:hypothetical protein